MTQTDLGPVNIRQGDTAEFVAQFFDANRFLITPLSATLSITYTNLGYASQTDNVVLSPVGGSLIGTWSSTNALAGLAPWTVTTVGVSSISQSGVVRVYDP
jgi:hypothetical protein